MIKTDDDFTNALGSKYNVGCWTLPQYDLVLYKTTDINYRLEVLNKDGSEYFDTTTGITFQIHFDWVQRIIMLYFHNGARGWYLGNEDVWDNINTPIAKLMSTKFQLMERVYTTAKSGYAVEDVLSEENTKHYYNVIPSTHTSLSTIHIVPKKHWEQFSDMSHIHQPDYKALEDKGVTFTHTGVGTFDSVAFPNIDVFLSVRGFGRNLDFEAFSNSYDPNKVDESIEAKVDNEEALAPTDCYYKISELGDKLLIHISPKTFVDSNADKHMGKFLNIDCIDLITDGYASDGAWIATSMVAKYDLEVVMMAYGFVKKDDMII